MTTATPSAAVAQISAVVHASVELLCAAFQKRSSPAVMAAFAVVAGRYSDTELKKAVGWWIDNKSTMPSPAEIGKVCRKLKGSGDAATETATDTFFCCSGCGMRVRTTEMESHSGFGGWCEADVRRRNGDPPPDQHEVRLRGLVVVRGTREDVDNLANFRASKGMA